MHNDLSAAAHAALKKFFGYDSFRPGQWPVIEAVMQDRDSLVLMPTGGGKSLCYQIPALVSPGCAVVVSPLIALMVDQVSALQANGIAASAIHSGRDECLNRHDLELAARGELKLLYISPERLLAEIDAGTWRLKPSFIAIDEAHCISQWGHDFRPVYTRLGGLKEILGGCTVMALTATADKLTREDIAVQLSLQEPFEYIGSFDRPNISLKVMPSPDSRRKIAVIRDMTARYPNDSGIVYTMTRKRAEELAETLTRQGERAVCYHAGLTSRQRQQAQRVFINGDVRVICATIAFGMGIDKSNIRWVVHYNMPGNIESYYQEVGRAGRDGLPAEAVMFYSLQDVILRRNMCRESGQPDINLAKLERMQDFCEARNCRRRILLSYFNETTDRDCHNCDVCTSPPQRIDGTVQARMALSAVVRSHGTLGANMLADVLRGTSRAGAYSDMPTYGVGRDLAHMEWMDYISQMVQLGLLAPAYDHQGQLQPTALGLDVVYGRNTITLAKHDPSRYRKQEKGNGKMKGAKAVETDPVKQLLETLKAVRKRVADKAGIPPYMVFNDASLLDMAKKRPSTLEEFGAVSGAGERKTVRFGGEFIKAIRKFEGLAANTKGQSVKETLLLHNAGVPVGEIARIKGVRTATVRLHVAELIAQGLVTTYAGIITRPEFETIDRLLCQPGDNVTLHEKVRMAGADPELIPIVRAIKQARRNG